MQKQVFENQLDSFKSLVEKDVSYAVDRFGLSVLYSLSPAEQWRVAPAVLGASEKDALYYYNEGTILAEEGDHAAAVKQLTKATDLDPKFAEACYNLAVCLQEEGENKESERMIRQYIAVVREQKEVLDRRTEEELEALEKGLR